MINLISILVITAILIGMVYVTVQILNRDDDTPSGGSGSGGGRGNPTDHYER